MKFSIRIIFCIFLASCLQVSAQTDLSGIPKKYHDVIEASKNGGCAFFEAEIIITQPSCNGVEDGRLCIDPDSITGGVGPYEFLWFGDFLGDPTAECINNLSAGSFNCIITDVGQGGVLCNFQASVVEPFAIVVLDWNEVPNSCFGICDGQAAPFVIGGAGGFTFQYDSGEITPEATNLCNPFQVTITDQDGCTADTIFHFNDAAQEILVDSIIVNTCFGESSGSIDITVSGGNPIPGPGYTYSWTSPVPGFTDTTSQNIENLSVGSYTVVVSDNSPCSISKTYVIQELMEILINPTMDPIECYGENEGGITLNTSGGVSPYSFVWTGPNVSTNSENQSNIPAGDYNVIITDSIGCFIEEDFVFIAPDSILIEGLVSELNCFADNDGSIVLTVSGGTQPYINYQWDSPACYTGPTNQADISNLCAGNYEITVTDTDNCSISETFELIEPSAISLDLDKVDVSCFGQDDGSIDLTITGGAQPTTVPVWSPLPFTVVGDGIQDLDPNIYTVDYTDNNGCVESASIEVLEDTEIVVNEVINNASCENETDGSITVTITGGVEPYGSIIWQNDLNVTIGNSTLLDDIGAGDYTLIVEDANGCMYTNTYTILAPDEIIITVDNIIPVQCFGENSGEIDISVTGGTGSFNYSWTGTNSNPSPSNTQDVSSLGAGTYTVVVTSSSCVASEIIIIEPAEEITLMFDVSPISCPGVDDGAVDLTIIGGELPLQSIIWTGPPCFPGAITEDISALCSGTYFVSIIDANGCLANGSITLDPALIINIQGVVVDNDCFDGSSGSIDITLVGAVGAPTFVWTGPNTNESTEDISNLEAGLYTVVVDVDGCQSTDDFIVDQNDSLYIDATVSPFPCNGATLGAIDITPHGGANPYTFVWTGPSIGPMDITNEDQSDLLAGTYTVTITDALDCIIQEQFVLEPSTTVFANGIVGDLSCFEANDGTISTNPSGGQIPYSFTWTGPNFFTDDTNQNLSALFPGDYNLSITDTDGCMVDTIMTVDEPQEIEITVNIVDPTCGNSNGVISISTIGGVGVTTVSVTDINGDPVVNINGLSAGVYTVLAVDNNACSSSQTVTLSNSEIVIDGTVTNITCFGDDDGAIGITITGAIGTANISWTGDGPINNPNGTNISNLIAGEYVVLVSDDNGCIATELFEVTENSEILVSVDITNVNCQSDTNGEITVTDTAGGSGGYTYFWNSAIHINFEATTIDNLELGIYELTVFDSDLCFSIFSYEIEADIELGVTALINSVECSGDSTGVIDITVTGGNPSYDYTWTGGSTDQDLVDVPAGIYFLSVGDENGCSKDTSFIISSNNQIFSSAIQTDVLCFGDSTGSIILENLGGLGPYTFSWSAPGFISSNQDIFNLPIGTYVLNITDDLNCEFDSSFVINQAETIIVEVTVNDVICFDEPIGSIIIDQITGGAGFVSATWDPMPAGSTVSNGSLLNIPPGDYTLTLEDENACSNISIHTVLNINTAILSTATITNVFCTGQDDGCIDLTVTGGIPGYNLMWAGTGITDPTALIQCDLGPGNYAVTIADNLNCMVDTFFTIAETNPLSITLTSLVHNNCFGDENGEINIEVNGGSPQFEYEWTNGFGYFETTQDISNLDGDIYNVHIVDINDCEIDQQFTVNEPNVLSFDLNTIDSNCGLDDGQASVSGITGGTVATTYSTNWFDQNNPIGVGTGIIDLSPGTYSVEVIDDNGCSLIKPFTISDNAGDITSMTTPISCFNEDDGGIVVTISGFTRPIDFVWSDLTGVIGIDSTISDLSAGTYTITATDALDCVVVESFILDSPELIVLDALINNETCPDAEDGVINLSVSGGTGDYTYAWNGIGILFPQNQDQQGLPPGTYTVEVTDENGCSVNESFTINPASEFTIVETITNVNCFGQNDASIAIDIDFGLFPPLGGLAYNWVGNGITANVEDQFNLDAGDYSLTVETPNGCLVQESYTIAPASEIILEISTVNSICLMSSGSASVIATGGNVALDYTYAWHEGNGNLLPDTDNTLDNVSAGVYDVNVTDDNGCLIEQEFVISDEGGVLDYTVDSISCPGLSDGAIDITYSGMTEPVGVIWTGPIGNYNPTDTDISGLQEGEYTVLITGNDGCILGDVIPVFENEFINSTANVTDVSCFQLNDGAIEITVTGGTGPFTITWMGPNGPIAPDAFGDIADLEPGDYFVTIVDSKMCSGNASYTINEPDLIEIITSINDATCFGENDGGIVIVNINGGSPNYSFTWTKDEDINFLSNFQNIDQITAGNYNLALSDLNGCVYNESFEIQESEAISIAVTTNNANCGLATGGASVVAMGGTGGYSYEWFDGAFLLDEDSDVIFDLTQGSYSVTVTDDNGCSENLTFSVQNDDYTVTAAILNTDCNSTSNGAIDITLSNDFIFPTSVLTWTGPDPTPPPSSLNITNLAAGIYTLTLADANGCPFLDSYEILEPDSIQINSIVSDVSCFGDESGSIVLSLIGGTPFVSVTPEYTFNWSVPIGAADPGNIHFSEDLPIGIYSIAVSDSLNCSNQIEIELTQPTALELVAIVQVPICESDEDGSIEIIVSGGVQDYTYLWSNDSITSSIQDLTIGDYTVIVEDDNACVMDSTFTINASIILNLDYVLENVSCFNASDGSIDLSATGGSEDFTFNWNSEVDPLVVDVVSEDITDLVGGDYYLSITDNINGCIKLDTIQIINPDSLFAIVDFENIQCFGNNDGVINIVTNGGTNPYDFNWTSGDPGFTETTESVDSLFAGNYVLEIADSNSCSKIYDFEVVEPDQLQIVVDNVGNAFCNTSEDGNITASVVGGVPGYAVSWLNDQGTAYSGLTISDIPAGDYFITVSDSNSCILQDTIPVAFDQDVLAIIQDQDPACNQLPVVLDGTQSTNATSYEWLDVDGQLVSAEEIAQITLSFNYNQFILRVSNGVCESLDTLSFIVHPLPLVDAGEDQDAFPNEEVEIGGDPSAPSAVSFSWSPGEALSDSTLSNPTYLTVGTQEFVLTITDENNCENRDSVIINLINQVEIPDGFSPNGDGINDAWTINNSDKFPNMVVKIYSRWGNKLFESNGYETAWTGMYDKKEMPVGTYYYTIDLRDPFFPKPFTGPLTIFR